MDARIHDCLDGTRRRHELTLAEREELARIEGVIGAVAGPLRSEPAPDLTASIMARLPQAAVQPVTVARSSSSGIDRAAGWFFAPRVVTLRMRPAYAVAAAAVILLAVALAPRSGPPGGGAAVRQDDAALPVGEVYVQFRVEVEGASRVALVGSFTGWQPEYELRETVPGTWSILIPLRPGVHDYAFVVDGERWLTDPHAFQIDDGFGGTNSRIALLSAMADAPT